MSFVRNKTKSKPKNSSLFSIQFMQSRKCHELVRDSLVSFAFNRSAAAETIFIHFLYAFMQEMFFVISRIHVITLMLNIS